jgi:hypothetical protein
VHPPLLKQIAVPTKDNHHPAGESSMRILKAVISLIYHSEENKFEANINMNMSRLKLSPHEGLAANILKNAKLLLRCGTTV